MPARSRGLAGLGWLQAWLAVGWASLGRAAGWMLTALINKDIFTSSLKDDAGDGASKKSRGYSQIHISLYSKFLGIPMPVN